MAESCGHPGVPVSGAVGRQFVTPATDVWGLGLVLLETACDQDPYPVGCPDYDEAVGPHSPPVPVRKRRRAEARRRTRPRESHALC
jgi:hypothetical protein